MCIQYPGGGVNAATGIKDKRVGKNSALNPVPTKGYKAYSIVSPQLAGKIEEFKFKLRVRDCGYPVITEWHPIIPEGWGEFPRLPVQRVSIYKGNETYAYSHHQAITKFGDKYVASWSNGFRHEDYIGQEPHFSYSDDGINWSEPEVIMHSTVESEEVRTNAGMIEANGKLYSYASVAHDYGRDVSPPGMYSLKPQVIPLEVHVTSDLKTWEHIPDICDNILLLEGPKADKDGRYICSGMDMTDMHAIVLIWDDASQLAEKPRVIHVADGPDGVKAEEGTWYQTDDGRIWIYQRDFANSLSLALTYSDDNGESWSDLLRTDFPNSLSRAYAGRLDNGKYYIVGNNYDVLLDRCHLQMAVSDDGYTFDRQYTLVDGPTTRRINGRHKENGYQYPSCYCDGDKLFVIYSVNKEDIEVAIVDVSNV